MTERAHIEPKQVRLLSGVKTGATAQLLRVAGGRGLNRRLAALGFVPGAAITVISNGDPGPSVVVVKDVKMALGRGVARQIQVQ